MNLVLHYSYLLKKGFSNENFAQLGNDLYIYKSQYNSTTVQQYNSTTKLSVKESTLQSISNWISFIGMSFDTFTVKKRFSQSQRTAFVVLFFLPNFLNIDRLLQ